MNILLVNDAAGLNSNLKKGLQELGHNVVHACPIDRGWQGRSFDYYFGNPGLSLFAKVKRNLLPFWKIRKFKGFDIVHFLLGITSFSGRLIKYRDLKFFKRNGSLLSYTGAGCDEISLLRVRPDVDSLPCCHSCMANDELGRGCERHILGWRSKAVEYLDLFDFCATPAYEYDHCHPLFRNAKHARIPVPIDSSAIEFKPAKPRKKPIIIHSPTRRGFKGTHVVLQAIQKLRERTTDFEFRIVEGLPHVLYLQVMRESDIYIDQVFSETAGTAALENLAMGKIVVSSNGPHAKSYFPFSSESPVVSVSSNPDSISESLFLLLQEKDDFESMAVRGRRFVEKHHDHIKIAQQFLDLWQS